MTPRRAVAASIGLVLMTTVVACGSGDQSSDEPVASSTPSSGAASVELNGADIEFAQGMIAHHEQAVEMAEMALDPNAGASEAVVDLATRIKAAQDPEIELMTSWLTAAGESVTMDMSGGHDMSSMTGMMSAGDMDSLAMMTGADFDRMWLEMMIEHHKGAVSQSQQVLEDGSSPDVLALANQIITAQQAEIAEMEALLNG